MRLYLLITKILFYFTKWKRKTSKSPNSLQISRGPKKKEKGETENSVRKAEKSEQTCREMEDPSSTTEQSVEALLQTLS
jgi:hypothetical protein